MVPNILDIYHENEVTDWAAVAGAGIWGVIHKASQGASVRDPAYAARREAARAAGLLWGAYHWGENADVPTQVAHFLALAQPDADTLLALDWEWTERDGSKAATMTVAQAEAFVTLVHERTGRWPVLYTGDLGKERLPAHGSPILSQCQLWLSQYGPRAVCPPGWSKPWAWQFTGDSEGPGPHAIPGVKGTGVDLSTYAGSRDELAAEWSGALEPVAAPVEATAPAETEVVTIEPTTVTVSATTADPPLHTSPTVHMSLGLIISAVLWLANKLGDWVDWLFGNLPDIQTDISTQLDAIKSLWALAGTGAHAAMTDSAMAFVAVAVALGVIYRRAKPRGA